MILTWPRRMLTTLKRHPFRLPHQLIDPVLVKP
jgi:hypothetical protein